MLHTIKMKSIKKDVIMYFKIKLRDSAQGFLEKHFSGESIDYREIIAIFLPILVDQAFLVCLNMVNTIMISSSGVASVSAVNMVDSLNLLLLNVIIAVATGGTVVVAQYKGNGNDAMVSKAAASTVSSVLLLSLIVSLLVIVFHEPILNLLFGRAQADVFNNAQIYIIGSSASYSFFAMKEAVCGALRGVGKTKQSLVLSLIMNLSYVLLNLLFINTLHMGVIGMAISMNISRFLGAACAFIYLTKIEITPIFQIKKLLDFNFLMLKKILYIGLPFAAEQMFFNGGKILTQIFIVSLGTYALATNAICGSIISVLQIPSSALCLTVITVVGQCMGRRDIKDARKFIRSFNRLSIFSFALVGLIVLPMLHPIVLLFHPPAQIIPVIIKIVLVSFVGMFLTWPVSFLTPSALRAAGDSKFTFLFSMLSMWLIRVVLGYILGIVLPLGIFGVYLAMNFEWFVRGLIFTYRLRGKKWYQHHLID